MTTLIQDIARKLLNMENHPFLHNYDKNDPISPIIKTFFIHFLHVTSERSLNKFKFFIEGSQNSIFFTNDIKDEFSILFSKIQKIYNSFRRIAFIYKYKKARIVVNTDMTLNEISEKDRNIICIYQNKSKYLFHILDLINIINASLTNSYVFFAEPLHVKNPFNNLAFNKSTLYNIYFFIKFHTNLYPELVFKYFRTNFDLTFFLYHNEPLVREYAIQNYVMKSPKNIIHKEIKQMLLKYNSRYKEKKNKIVIDPDFPLDKLIKIMKPYLLLYLNTSYSLIPLIKQNSKTELTYKLKKFQTFNPGFGRKIIVLKYKSLNICNFNRSLLKPDYDFDDKHVPFNTITDFTTSHLFVNMTKINYHVDTIDDNNEFIFNDESNANVNNYEDNDDDYEYDITTIVQNPSYNSEEETEEDEEQEEEKQQEQENDEEYEEEADELDSIS